MCTTPFDDRASSGTTLATDPDGQKNSISICSNSRERNVKLRGVISLRKLLPIWAIPNGTRTRVLSSTFLKLTKMPCAVSGRKKVTSSSPPSAPSVVLNIRLNSRGSVSVSRLLASGPSTCVVESSLSSVIDSSPTVILSASLVRSLKNFMPRRRTSSSSCFGLGHRGDEDLFVLVLDPATANLIEPVSLFRFATVDHVIVEQVVVAAALPDLRMHDDRAVESDHLESPWRTGRRDQFVVASDHVVPPGLLEVAFQLDAQRAVVPKTLDAAVDFAGLKQESTSLAERHDFFHRLHGSDTWWSGSRIAFFNAE